MKVAIFASKEFGDKKVLVEAIQASSFKITEIISCVDKTVDKLAEEYADTKGLEKTLFKVEWNNLDHPDAEIKINSWGKEYNAKAAFIRDNEVIQYCDAAIVIDDGSLGYTLKKLKESSLQLYIHSPVNKNNLTSVNGGYVYEF